MSESDVHGGLSIAHTIGVVVGTALTITLFFEIQKWLTTHRRRPSSSRTSEIRYIYIFGVSSTILLLVDWFSIYNVSIRHSYAPDYSQRRRLSDLGEPQLCGVITIISQFSFCNRAAAKLKRSSSNRGLQFVRILFIFITSILAATTLLSSLTLKEHSSMGLLDTAELISSKKLTLIWLLAGALNDALFSTVLSYYFIEESGGSKYWKNTEDIVLIRNIFENGGFTALFGILAVLLFIYDPKSALFIPFADCVPRVAALSCMISINARTLLGSLLTTPSLIFTKKHTPAPSATDQDLFSISFINQELIEQKILIASPNLRRNFKSESFEQIYSED